MAFIGRAYIKVTHDTMKAAVQYYFDKVMFVGAVPPKVQQVSSDDYEKTFEIEADGVTPEELDI